MSQDQVRKPRASLGSSEGEDIFGTFDAGVARRFLAMMVPYRRAFLMAVVAVLVSAASVVAIPALIGRAVNAAVARDGALLDQTLIAFAGLVAVYSTAFFIEQWLSARLAQRVIFDIRRKMFDHFQDVSLSFMDKTHVGRIMSRLQGDVNALQEFLESSTGAVGDFAMLIGIAAVLISMDWRLGLLTLTVLPILIAVRAVWLPFSKSSFRE
ncbi:MAG: ABC transporter transmembrane domain-containing protein, partial [Phenylobacterium sp.]